MFFRLLALLCGRAASCAALWFACIPSTSAQTTYDEWKAQVFTLSQQMNPAISGEGATPINDGIPNLLKYAGGYSPIVSVGQTVGVSTDGQGRLTLSYNRRSTARDLIYAPEVSGDLLTWRNGGEFVEPFAVSIINGDFEAVTVRAATTLNGPPVRFMRLRVNRSPVPPGVSAPPSGLIATAVASTWITLSWKAVPSDVTGYRVERREPGGNGGWIGVATVAAGVRIRTDTQLQSSHLYAYRVVALNAAGASNPSNEASATTLPLSGGGGDSADDSPSYPLALDDPTADPDEDQLTNAEEIAIGTDPMNRDSDGDGVPDGLDGWPLDPDLHPPRLPAASFALVDLGPKQSYGYYYADGFNSHQRRGVVLNNNGQAVVNDGTRSYLWQGGQLTSLGENVITAAINDAGTILAGENIPAGAYPYSDYSFKSFLFSAGGQRTYLNYIGVYPASPGQQEGDVYEPQALALNNAGAAVGTAYEPYRAWRALFWSGPAAASFDLGNLPDANDRVYPNDPGPAYDNSRGLDDAAAAEAINATGQIAGWSRECSDAQPGDILNVSISPPYALVWPNSGGPPISLGFGAAYGINNAGQVVGFSYSDGSSSATGNAALWIPDGQSYKKKDAAGGLAVNDRLQIVGGQNLTHNGQTVDLGRFFAATDTQGNSKWSYIGATSINNQGMIGGNALYAQTPDDPNVYPEPHAFILVPLEFVTRDAAGRDFSASTVGVTNRGPALVLDQAVNTDVTDAGSGQGRLTVRGTVRDAIADTVPAGQGADIPFVNIYVNEQLVAENVSLSQEADGEQTSWRRYPRKWRFAQSVTFPADGTARITVETAPNAAGLNGSDEILVTYSRTRTGSLIEPPKSVAYDIQLSSGFSTTAVDTITLRAPGQTPEAPGRMLRETGVNTRVFKNTEGNSLMVAFASGYQPTAGLDTVRCQVFEGESGMMVEGATAMTCSETGANTNVFPYRQELPGYGYGDTYSYALAAVSNEPARAMGAFHPVKIRAAVPEAQASTVEIEFAGKKLRLGPKDAVSGLRYAGVNSSEPWVGFIVADPQDANALRLIYWDVTGGQLQNVALPNPREDLKAKLVWGGVRSGEATLTASRLRWIDKNGVPVGAVPKLSVEALIDFAQGDPDITIDDAYAPQVEVTGAKSGDRVRVVSSEIPTDNFDLTRSPSGSGRSAPLTEISTGIFRSTGRVLVYSSPNDEVLGNSVWESLKARGYLAVHNAEPFSVQDQGGKGVNQFRYRGDQDHHVFNKFRDASPRYRDFFKNVFGSSFEVDRYTIPVETKSHRGFSNQVTQSWKGFVEQLTDANGNLLVSNKEARRLTLNKAFSLAEQYDLDLSLLRPHSSEGSIPLTDRKRLRRPGSTVDELLKLDQFDGKIRFSSGDAKAIRWKKVAQKGTKRFGKTFLRGVPYLGHALTAWAVVSFVNNPAASMASELGISEDAARDLLAGRSNVTFNNWFGGTSVTGAQLADGEYIYLGMPLWVVNASRNGTGEFIITRVTWYEIDSIKTNTTPGTVTITGLRRGTENERVLYENVVGLTSGTPEVGDPFFTTPTP